MKKEYTGHKKILIDGKNIAEHLRGTIDDECRRFIVDRPTDAQIAVVVSALRMHHTLVYASQYDFSELHERDKPTDFYPIQSSIGRFFRDSGGDILQRNYERLTK